MGLTGNKRALIPAVVLFVAASACASGQSEPAASTSLQGKEAKTMTITSAVFQNQKPIPVEFTCKGQNVSPPLSWEGVPENTRSFALIADDPDAPMGTWVHWVIYNIPADAKALPSGVAKVAKPNEPAGAIQGVNSSRRLGYAGPMPPPGHGPHRYFFKLYALDIQLPAKTDLDKAGLEKEMKGHILAQGELMGTYERR